MTFLVDANVLSEATKPTPDPSVVAWLRRHEREIAIDPVILGEIRYGILILPSGKRRRRLESWFDSGISCIECYSWDAATGLRWAQLLAELRGNGLSMPIKDSLIAATALVHQVPVVTRNQSDFEKADVEVVNPFP